MAVEKLLNYMLSINIDQNLFFSFCYTNLETFHDFKILIIMYVHIICIYIISYMTLLVFYLGNIRK